MSLLGMGPGAVGLPGWLWLRLWLCGWLGLVLGLVLWFRLGCCWDGGCGPEGYAAWPWRGGAACPAGATLAAATRGAPRW